MKNNMGYQREAEVYRKTGWSETLLLSNLCSYLPFVLICELFSPTVESWSILVNYNDLINLKQPLDFF